MVDDRAHLFECERGFWYCPIWSRAQKQDWAHSTRTRLGGDLGCHRCFCKADVPQERIGSEAAQSTQLKAERAQESGSVVRKAQLLVIMLVKRGHVGQVNALRARGAH